MDLTKLDFDTLFARFSGATDFYLGYSGGIDSHVLLHLLARKLSSGCLKAIHVNHGLSPNADDWQQHCQKVCDALGVQLVIRSVKVDKQPGDSLEAVARAARYECFTDVVTPGGVLLTAHNANDQAETVLLQLLRGAGIAGLAAMPTYRKRGKVLHMRPLLGVKRADIEAYAAQQGLHWVEDESNVCLNFDRNYLRHRIMPEISKRWPSAEETICRSAQHCAAAKHLVTEVAQHDLASLLITENQLEIAGFLQRSSVQQRNILRQWLVNVVGQAPSTKQLQQIITHVIGASVDACPLFNWRGYELRRFQSRLYLCQLQSLQPPKTPIIWDLTEDLWIPGINKLLSVQMLLQQGLSSFYVGKPLEVRFRQHFAGGSSLKKQLQRRRIPPWERAYVPLIYFNHTLLAIYHF